MISRLVTFRAQFVAVALLSACGEGGSETGSFPENDSENCSTTPLTSQGVQVDINGNVTPNPTPAGGTTSCESSTQQGEALDTSRITTRFDTTENYNVWDCVRADGSSLHYALLAYEDFHKTFNYKHYGFEIDPGAADTIGSQQLYTWRAPRSPDANTITLWAQNQVDEIPEGVESKWSNITFSTAGTMSLDSSTQGSMQCNRTVGFVPLDASRFDIGCDYRGPIFACR